MSYIRKSYEEKTPTNYLLQQDRNLSYTANYAHPLRQDYNPRGRYASNQKKYDYHHEINQSRDNQNTRESRPRTPSAGEFNKYRYDKYESSLANMDETNGAISQNKLKRIAKTYAAGIGGANFSQYNNSSSNNNKQSSCSKFMNIQQPHQNYAPIERKQNMNTNNQVLPVQRGYELQLQQRHRIRESGVKQKSYSKRMSEEDVIKDSFERVNQQKILQKINRINKLNTQINDRLQRILVKVTID